jgi:hypothetical protein
MEMPNHKTTPAASVFDVLVPKPWRIGYLIFCRKLTVKSQNKNTLEQTAIRPRSEAATAMPKQLSGANRGKISCAQRRQLSSGSPSWPTSYY